MDHPVWQEPVRGDRFPREYFGLSGIEQLRLFLSGHVGQPPIGRLTGMHLTEAGAGNATFVMPIDGWLRSPQGIMTVGAIAILADGPLGCAIQSTLPPATGYTTTELSINMTRPVPQEGRLVARGRLVHGGRRLGLSEVFITDDDGRLIAHGTSRCAIFPPNPDVGTPPAEPPTPTVEPEPWTPPSERPPEGLVLDQHDFETRSGLEILKGFATGEIADPPSYFLLGQKVTAVDEGKCEFSMPTSGWLASPTGFVEGGVTGFLADCAMAAAVQTTVPAGTAIAPTDLRVQFLRPVPTDGTMITARASVEHRGRGLAATRAEVTNSQGKLVALATGATMILPGRRANLEGL